MAGDARPRPFRIAVIGASAGGVQALSRIIPALPATTSFPVVIVVHLPADQPSLLATVLAQKAAVKVCEGSDKLLLEPGTVYFAPPGYHLLVERGGTLALSVDAPVHYCRPSIDVLFESACASFGRRVLGIILTGANPDGAAGLRCVREAGGVAIAQAPGGAYASAMPQAAIDAARPDLVLTVGEIAQYLREAAGAKP